MRTNGCQARVVKDAVDGGAVAFPVDWKSDSKVLEAEHLPILRSYPSVSKDRRWKAPLEKRPGYFFRFLWLCAYLLLTYLLSIYAFPELLSLLRPEHATTATYSTRQIATKKLWKDPPNREYLSCVNPSATYADPPQPSMGYLLVQSNGGLNQMRAGICDMVAVARILNATLVVPELDKRSFWADSSNFSDIFDEDYFIESLRRDIPVVRSLPGDLLSSPRAAKQFRSWSDVQYYKEEIAPLWKDFKVIHALKSDARLANNNLPSDIQKLRCRVHYDALRFAPGIEAFGTMLVDKLKSQGPYIALHLRYEKDMLAFSGCTYGLTNEEADELTRIREETAHWKVKAIDASEQRTKGFCPLTPKEVGIFLTALGYPRHTQIYVAAGELYGGQERMAALSSYFPNVVKKETIATAEELAPFMDHASQMAALDYVVSVESDVFVPSYSGNMARAVEGHRRYLGHRKTVTPDRKELVALYDQIDKGVLKEGPELSNSITALHRSRQGAPRKRKGPLKGTKGRDRFRTEEAFYTNPLPDCLCQKSGTSSSSSAGTTISTITTTLTSIVGTDRQTYSSNFGNHGGDFEERTRELHAVQEQ